MIIHHHLGLGDHFICYGLVRHFSESEDVTLVCKKTNHETVVDMYKHHCIEIICVDDDSGANEIFKGSRRKILKIGFTSECETEEEFGREFYRQAGLPYETRWKYELPKPNKVIQPVIKNQVIIADSADYPIFIGASSFTRLIDVGSMLQWKEVLENASEIHCIESSVKQYIEFLNPKGKLFLHKFKGKSWRVVPSKHNWTIIEN